MFALQVYCNPVACTCDIESTSFTCLDGTHILSATLGLLIVASSNAGEGLDVEDEGETGMGSSVTRRTEARRRWWHRVVSGTAMFLTAVCVGGGAILQALS